MTGAIECRKFGRDFTADGMALPRPLIAADPQPTRAALSRELHSECSVTAIRHDEHRPAPVNLQYVGIRIRFLTTRRDLPWNG